MDYIIQKVKALKETGTLKPGLSGTAFEPNGSESDSSSEREASSDTDARVLACHRN